MKIKDITGLKKRDFNAFYNLAELFCNTIYNDSAFMLNGERFYLISLKNLHGVIN